MAIATDLAVVSNADVLTGWTGLGLSALLALNDDPRVHGNNCIQCRVDGSPAIGYVGFTPSPVLNLTDGRHVFLWFMNITCAATEPIANGGMRIFVGSGGANVGGPPPTNSKSWYVDGSDTLLTAGWKCYVVDPNGTPDLATGTANVQTINALGWGCNITGAISNKTLNLYHDVLRVGTGLTITAGNTASPISIANVYAADSAQANAYGVVVRSSGINFLGGKLTFGNTSQTSNTVYVDTSQVFVWQNFPVANTFYELKTQATASPTFLTFGNYSSGLITGACSIRGAGDTSGTKHAIWRFSAGAANTVTKLFGVTISEMIRGTFNANTEIRDSIFTNFGDITPNGAMITGCTFQDVKNTAPILGGTALIINATTDLAAVTLCEFINCRRALRITANGTYTANGLMFTGNEYDIENTATGNVVIEAINSANPGTYINTNGGTTTINNPKTLSMTGLVSGSEVYVYLLSDLTELAGNANVTGTFSWNYNANNANVFITVTKPTYKWLRYDNLQIGSAGITLLVQQQPDLGYLNPVGP